MRATAAHAAHVELSPSLGPAHSCGSRGEAATVALPLKEDKMAKEMEFLFHREQAVKRMPDSIIGANNNFLVIESVINSRSCQIQANLGLRYVDMQISVRRDKALFIAHEEIYRSRFVTAREIAPAGTKSGRLGTMTAEQEWALYCAWKHQSEDRISLLT